MPADKYLSIFSLKVDTNVYICCALCCPRYCLEAILSSMAESIKFTKAVVFHILWKGLSSCFPALLVPAPQPPVVFPPFCGACIRRQS